jgi:CSLREA domain-containing protein
MITTIGFVACLVALMALLTWHDDAVSTQDNTAAPSTTITVNTAEDESNNGGDCSLREAVRAANSNAAVDACAAGRARSRDTIRFSLGQGPPSF